MTEERCEAMRLALRGMSEAKKEAEDSLYLALVDFGFKQARKEPLKYTKEELLNKHRALLVELDAIRNLILERQHS